MHPKTVEEALKIWVETAREANAKIRRQALQALDCDEEWKPIEGVTQKTDVKSRRYTVIKDPTT